MDLFALVSGGGDQKKVLQRSTECIFVCVRPERSVGTQIMFNFADLLSRNLLDRTWEQQFMEPSVKLRASTFTNSHILLLYCH